MVPRAQGPVRAAAAGADDRGSSSGSPATCGSSRRISSPTRRRRSTASIATPASPTTRRRSRPTSRPASRRAACPSTRAPACTSRSRRLGLGRRRHVRARHFAARRPSASTSPPTIAASAPSSSRRASGRRVGALEASSCSGRRVASHADHPAAEYLKYRQFLGGQGVPGRVRHEPAFLRRLPRGVQAGGAADRVPQRAALSGRSGARSARADGTGCHCEASTLDRATRSSRKPMAPTCCVQRPPRACRRRSTNPSARTRRARPSAPRSRRSSPGMAGERIDIPLVIGGREAS